MSKYLVIDFNRYDTHKSQHRTVEANNPLEALASCLPHQDEDSKDEEMDYLTELYEEVSDVFSCVPLEESDYLIYLLTS